MSEEDPTLLARILGRLAYEFTLLQPLLPTYTHLLLSALFPIYAGAHASLSRPSSAAKPASKKKKRKLALTDSDSDSEDEEEEEHKMEGLAPSDAIIMPLFAGATLAGLYFLIKWLEDPGILNKVLNAYFAVFGVFSVGRLVADGLDVGHRLIFPRRYVRGGRLWRVDGRGKVVRAVKVGDGKDGEKEEGKEGDLVRTPLPGFLAGIPLPESVREYLWKDRAMPTQKWTLRVYLHRIFAGTLRIGAHGVVGSIIGLAAVLYFNLVDKPWYLTNLMGFGFSYGALQLMSPTTFGTGSAILGALFFYDVYFVFYTPMMVTVAKSLDVPIKLVFPRPAPAGSSAAASLAMLGLGDVVLPGIMIGLALRFDHYLFYLRQQKRVPTSIQTDTTGKTETKEMVVKPKYHSLSGRWTDYFWTHSLFGRPLFPAASASATITEPPFTFPKPYFTAAMTGYVLGMLTTLGVMQVWGHAQPALLYLVPGVLGSLWTTALVRGEIREMWAFSEEVDDEEDAEKSGEKKNKEERTSFFSLSEKKEEERKERMRKTIARHVTKESDDEDDENEASDADDKVRRVAGHRSEREVFSFSLEAPWKLKAPRSIKGKGKKGEADGEGGEKQKWVPMNGTEVVDGGKRVEVEEPAGKRIRVA